MTEEDNDTDDYLNSEEHLEHVKDFHRKVYFNTSYRKKLIKDNQELQKKAINVLDTTHPDDDYQERKAYVLWEKILDIANGFIDLGKNAEEHNRQRILKYGKYSLYKNRKSDIVVLNCTFYKPHLKRFKVNCMVFPKGMWKRMNHGILKFKAIDFKEYRLVDKGKFTSVWRNFDELYWNFRGKKVKFIFRFFPVSQGKNKVTAQFINIIFNKSLYK